MGSFAGSYLKSVGLTGLEPVTLRLSSACSNQLSYKPVLGRHLEVFRPPQSKHGAPEFRTVR